MSKEKCGFGYPFKPENVQLYSGSSKELIFQNSPYLILIASNVNLKSDLDKIIKEIQPIHLMSQLADFNQIILEQTPAHYNNTAVNSMMNQNVQDGNGGERPAITLSAGKLLNNFRLCSKV